MSSIAITRILRPITQGIILGTNALPDKKRASKEPTFTLWESLSQSREVFCALNYIDLVRKSVHFPTLMPLKVRLFVRIGLCIASPVVAISMRRNWIKKRKTILYIYKSMGPTSQVVSLSSSLSLALIKGSTLGASSAATLTLGFLDRLGRFSKRNSDRFHNGTMLFTAAASFMIGTKIDKFCSLRILVPHCYRYLKKKKNI